MPEIVVKTEVQVKPIMKMSDLIKMGFPKDYLLRAYRVRGQKFARKMNPNNPHSTILFEMEPFNKWRLANE